MRPVALALLLAACLTAATAAASPPKVDAKAWFVRDAITGEVLLAHDIRARRAIASITKLMTVVVALQHLKLGDVVSVDPQAAAVGQESVYLTAGQQITVRDLVKAALIQSANDAADALALATAPSFPAFAALMNAEARKLHLTDSHFVRPDGLDAPDEYSSARDVMRLALSAMRNPVIRATVRETTDTLADGFVLHTWDDLLSTFPGVFGVKTGHTDQAHWGQVAAVHGAGTTIYAVILGSPSQNQRDADLAVLLAYGIAQYRKVEVVSAGTPYATAQLPYGQAPLALVAGSPLDTAARIGRPLTERVVAPVALSLPVVKGQVVGRIEVWAGKRKVGERPLVASRSVGSPSLAGRLAWYAGRTVHNLVSFIS